jgi:hypothetical protein
LARSVRQTRHVAWELQNPLVPKYHCRVQATHPRFAPDTPIRTVEPIPASQNQIAIARQCCVLVRHCSRS